jgi:dolichol-phosphate mannosyltransferase
MPARDEAALIGAVLDRLLAEVSSPCEVLVVVDRPDDPTIGVVERYAARWPAVSCLVNDRGTGPAQAIRAGMAAARAPVLVVTMADGSDDPRQINALAGLVEGGAAVAAASRYSAGGSQLGGQWPKCLLSRLAGRSLQLLARPGTSDATNSFKAYSAALVASVGIDSRHGFEVGIELTAKARRMRLPVAELPTTWRGRQAGRSSFRLARWLPRYLRWYAFCFGPPLTAEQIRTRTGTCATPGRSRAGASGRRLGRAG